MKFFKSSLLTSTSILPLIDSKSYYAFVRWFSVETSTISEHQIASRIARAAMDPEDYDAVDDPLVRVIIKRKSKSIDNLIIHYTHEAQLASSNRMFSSDLWLC